MALPTNGRVILDTTVGEIDIELWSKETPRACRNFLALAMEGYYDGVIFHRVVPGFLVQTGDRTGTGGGGESFYGEPFEDEIHPRLRFAHRGMVGMANNGQKNSNDSQFFITLDRADELHGKHTLFGICRGDTVYNVMKIGEMELGKDERPVYPPKIKSVRIIDNPFPDIIPRITAAEKRAQQKAREQAQREREDEMKRRSAKKNTKLLSFAEEGGNEDADEPETSFKKKAIVRPDLIDEALPGAVGTKLPDFVTQPKVSVAPVDSSRKAKEPVPSEPRRGAGKEEDLTKIREKHAKEKASTLDARQQEIAKMEAEIKKLTKRRGGNASSDSEEETKKKKPKVSYLAEELSKYSAGRGLHKKGKKKDESDVLAAMHSFRSKLQGTRTHETDDAEADPSTEKQQTEGEGAGTSLPAEDPGMEIDDDKEWMGHKLHFPKDNSEEVNKAERDYEVIDPRARNARAKEEEKQRRKESKKDRGRHRR